MNILIKGELRKKGQIWFVVTDYSPSCPGSWSTKSHHSHSRKWRENSCIHITWCSLIQLAPVLCSSGLPAYCGRVSMTDGGRTEAMSLHPETDTKQREWPGVSIRLFISKPTSSKSAPPKSCSNIATNWEPSVPMPETIEGIFVQTSTPVDSTLAL